MDYNRTKKDGKPKKNNKQRKKSGHHLDKMHKDMLSQVVRYITIYNKIV